MTKYTQVLKQQIVEYYFQHAQSLSQTSKHVQVAPRCIRHWVAQYQYSGLDGLAVLHIPRKYRLEDKLKAIEYLQHTELTFDQIALKLGVSNGSVVYQWLQRFNKFGINGLIDKPKGQQAVNKLPKEAMPILHSDQGWQYQMPSYRKILADNQIQISMSRKGNCLDNGAMESFFGRLKTECFYVRQFDTADDIEQAVHQYIEYYNTERIQGKLKGLSPIQYRTQSVH